MGNREAKELMCMTHGHELSGGGCWREWGVGQRGIKGRKKWENCNSIINKIYFKNYLPIFSRGKCRQLYLNNNKII